MQCGAFDRRSSVVHKIHRMKVSELWLQDHRSHGEKLGFYLAESSIHETSFHGKLFYIEGYLKIIHKFSFCFCDTGD